MKHGVERRVRGPRALLRAAEAAAGHPLLHQRRRAPSCGPATSGVGPADRKGLRHRLLVHAGRDRPASRCTSSRSRGAAGSSIRAPSLPKPSTRHPNQEVRGHDRSRARAEFVARRGVARCCRRPRRVPAAAPATPSSRSRTRPRSRSCGWIPAIWPGAMPSTGGRGGVGASAATEFEVTGVDTTGFSGGYHRERRRPRAGT